jgi:hypothetical protein
VTARLKGRRRQADRLISQVARWVDAEPAIHALCLVGSYARGHEGMASDVDLVLLCAEPDAYSAAAGWFSRVSPGSRLVRTATWGPVREQRWRLRSGLLAEVNLAPVSWADVPLDGGTRRVLGDGHRILRDPHGTLERAASALPT